MKRKYLYLCVAGVLALNASMAYGQAVDIGGAIGGALGDKVGSKIGDGAGKEVAREVVRLAGEIIGSEIGKYIEEADERAAIEAEAQALEDEKTGVATWKNKQNGNKGKVVASKPYSKEGNKCRKYTHTVSTKEESKAYKGEACKGSDGKWVATSLTPVPTAKPS